MFSIFLFYNRILKKNFKCFDIVNEQYCTHWCVSQTLNLFRYSNK